MIRSDWVETAKAHEPIFREVVRRLPVIPLVNVEGSIDDIAARYSSQTPVDSQTRVMIDGFNVLPGKFDGDQLVLIRYGERSVVQAHTTVYSILVRGGVVPDIRDWRLTARKTGSGSE